MCKLEKRIVVLRYFVGNSERRKKQKKMGLGRNIQNMVWEEQLYKGYVVGQKENMRLLLT